MRSPARSSAYTPLRRACPRWQSLHRYGIRRTPPAPPPCAIDFLRLSSTHCQGSACKHNSTASLEASLLPSEGAGQDHLHSELCLEYGSSDSCLHRNWSNCSSSYDVTKGVEAAVLSSCVSQAPGHTVGLLHHRKASCCVQSWDQAI